MREFYRLNAGFFLVIAALAFGFMSSIEHRALAEFFVSAPVTTLIPAMLWTVYAYKIIQFNTQSTRRHGNEFLYAFILLDKRSRWMACMSCAAQQFAPALAYGIFITGTGLQRQHGIPAILVVLWLAMITALIAFMHHYTLTHPAEEKKISRVSMLLNRTFTRQYPQFIIGWIARRQGVALIGTKLFGCLLLYATTKLYQSDYDVRLLAMGATAAFGSSVVLVFHIHRFNNFHFQFVRSLPLSLMKRMVYTWIALLVLCLPELALLAGRFPQHLGTPALVLLSLYGFSLWTLAYGYLYIRDIRLEVFIHRCGVAGFLTIVALLFGIPLWLFVLVPFGAGLFLLHQYYYRFEFVSETGSEK